MGENLADVVERLGGILHWLGKYEEANACNLLARFLRTVGIDTLDTFERHLDDIDATQEAQEKAQRAMYAVAEPSDTSSDVQEGLGK